MRTSVRNPVPVELALAVQYGTPAPDLPRWRLRRWVRRALDFAVAVAPNPPSFATFTLRLVDAAEGHALNQQFRDRDYATNVLTFEYGRDASNGIAGDIVLCMPVLRREALEQGKPLLDHAAHLTVHGVLHSLGYDHLDPAEAAEMESLETRILAQMKIADPYAEIPQRAAMQSKRNS